MFYIKCPKCGSIDIREIGYHCIVETDVVVERDDHGYSVDTNLDSQDVESYEGMKIECHTCTHVLAEDGMSQLQDMIDNGLVRCFSRIILKYSDVCSFMIP